MFKIVYFRRKNNTLWRLSDNIPLFISTFAALTFVMRKEMQTLLDDIELDIQELKCLMQAVSADANPALRVVARRHIQQMRARLDALQQSLDETPVVETVAPVTQTVVTPVTQTVVTPVTQSVVTPVSPIVSSEPLPAADIKEVETEAIVISESAEATPAVIVDTPKPMEPQPVASPILAERIKPATDLRHAISLNDSFRFAREIFGGDTARMNEVIRQLGAASSLDEALTLFSSAVQSDEENETLADFIELLKKYFS